jgi:hypothetical protein
LEGSGGKEHRRKQHHPSGDRKEEGRRAP